MSVAPTPEQSMALSDQAGASKTANSAIFLSDISGTAINPAIRGDVPQWLPSEQTLWRQPDLASQPADTVASYQPAIISSTYLQGLQSSLYGSSGDSSSTLSSRTFAKAGMLRGNIRGDNDEDDSDGDDGDGGGGGGGGGNNGGGRNFLSFLSRMPILGGLFGMMGSMFGGGFGGGCSRGGGGCNGGDCSTMMAARNRVSNQALYSSPGMPFWAFRPGYGGGNKSA